MKLIQSILLACAIALTPMAAVAGGSVNINTANAQTLARMIKGIGLKKAQAIVAYRTRHGRFKTVDQLQNVKGIGKKTIDRSRSVLKVDG
jgi:competence protein ComEA